MDDFEARLRRFFYDPDEDVSGLLDLGDTTLDVVPAEAQEPPEEFLGFLLGDERFLVPLISVREVGKVPRLTEVPHSPEALVGVMNLRGELLPVYDAAAGLGIVEAPRDLASPQAATPPREMRVVVVHVPPEAAGLVVDGLLGVIRLPYHAFQSPGPGVGQRGGRAAIVALAHHEGRLHCLLDPQELLP